MKEKVSTETVVEVVNDFEFENVQIIEEYYCDSAPCCDADIACSVRG